MAPPVHINQPCVAEEVERLGPCHVHRTRLVRQRLRSNPQDAKERHGVVPSPPCVSRKGSSSGEEGGGQVGASS